MSETKYLKCPCQQCGGPIEFPAHGIGMALNCPHCGEKTTLFAPATSASPLGASSVPERTPTPAPPLPAEKPGPVPSAAPDTDIEVEASIGEKPRSSRKWITAAVVLVLIAAGAAIFAFKDRWPRSQPPPGTGRNATNGPGSPASTAAPQSNTNAAVPKATAAKSIDDLKVGPITLDKAKGSRLVYGVGVMRNESDHQRFGIHIELELTDARGSKVGVAKDYRSVLEPHQEWHFRALVLDAKAVAAKVLAIREDE